jgi:hypothetical protein
MKFEMTKCSQCGSDMLMGVIVCLRQVANQRQLIDQRQRGMPTAQWCWDRDRRPKF